MKKYKNIFVQGAVSTDQIGRSIQSHSEKKQIGAHSIFLGQVKDDEKKGGRVQMIRYSTYEEMALAKATEIREELFSKFDLTCMHIYHSLGEVKAGEICLFVFVSSPHRKNAIEACSELIERIKKELPIWGEEVINKELKTWKENF
jgi:molybdopterin synthase catalytic subunit